MSNIKFSEKHGVNPSVQLCFFCRKEMGVALFGRLPTHRAKEMFGKEFVKDLAEDSGEVEAPRHVVLGLDPCEGCEVWSTHSKDGVFFIEATEVDGAPMFSGNFQCVRESAVKRMLNPGEILDTALALRMVLMHPKDYAELFPNTGN